MDGFLAEGEAEAKRKVLEPSAPERAFNAMINSGC
jgi:hypothetical protein